MKKSLIIFFVLIFAEFSGLYSQSAFSLKNEDRKLLKISIWDISGKENTGFLVSYSDTGFVISNIAKDSLIYISSEEIYRMKVEQNTGNYSFVWKTFCALELLNIEEALRYELNGTYGFSTPFVIGQLIVIPGTLAALFINDNVNYDYIVDTDEGKYNAILSVFNKFSKNINTKNLKEKFADYDTSAFSKKNITRNEDELLKIKKPLYFYSPDRIARFHFSVNRGDYYIFNSKTYFDNSLVNLQLNDEQTETYTHPEFELYYGIRITKNLRINFKTCETISGLSNSYVRRYFYVNYKSLGVDYVLKPATRSLKSRHEFAFGLGADYMKIRLVTSLFSPGNMYEGDYEVRDEQYVKTLSCKLSASYDYYLIKNLSLQAKISSDIAPDINSNEVNLVYVDGTNKSFPAAKLNLSSLQWSIGIALHL